MADTISNALFILVLVLIVVALPLVGYAVWKLIIEPMRRRKEAEESTTTADEARQPATSSGGTDTESTNPLFGINPPAPQPPSSPTAPPASPPPTPPTSATSSPVMEEEPTSVIPVGPFGRDAGQAAPQPAARPAIAEDEESTQVALAVPRSEQSQQGRVCPRCGTVNAPDAVYCKKCGYKLV